MESKLEFWKGKQLEIEDKFKDVHSAPEEIATCIKSKTRKAEKKKKKKEGPNQPGERMPRLCQLQFKLLCSKS